MFPLIYTCNLMKALSKPGIRYPFKLLYSFDFSQTNYKNHLLKNFLQIGFTILSNF